MQSTKYKKLAVLLLGFAVFFGPAAYGYTVLQMDLNQLVGSSDKVFRATVLEMTLGSMPLGGAELPTVTYKLHATEVLKGDIPSEKGEQVLEVTMLGTIKPPADSGNYRRFSALPELPQLAVGREYLLMTTAPSAAGLSTTVGLGQGCFELFHSTGKTEMAANLLNNRGLFEGPVEYTELVTAIQGALAQ